MIPILGSLSLFSKEEENEVVVVNDMNSTARTSPTITTITKYNSDCSNKKRSDSNTHKDKVCLCVPFEASRLSLVAAAAAVEIVNTRKQKMNWFVRGRERKRRELFLTWRWPLKLLYPYWTVDTPLELAYATLLTRITKKRWRILQEYYLWEAALYFWHLQ